MKKYIYLLIIPFIISCTNIQFKNSLKTYNNKNYKSAIEQFDKYIEEGNNSALKVKAKLYRSKAYYILGKNEIENDNYNTASELLFLANSDKADTLLDNCYYQIAKELIRNDDYDKGLNYLKFIIDNLSNSNLMPEVLFTKLKIEFEVNDDIETSYQTYKVLQNNFPDSKSYYSGKKIVNQYMPELLEKVKVLRKNNEFELALEKLFIYIKYPADYTNEIESLIGNVYFSWAEKLIKNKKLLEAEEYFRTAEKYNPQLSNSVAEKLNQICSIYIEDGDKLLTQRKINEAVEAYKTSLNVIEDYQPAIKKIEHAEEIAAKIKRANELVSEGDKYFNDKEYQKALNIYNQAYQLDDISYIKEKIDNAYVWYRITNDPENYAEELIHKYDNGSIIKEIAKKEEEVLNNYSRQDIKITKWQILNTVTKNSYEVRYSIMTPEKNYFLRWLIRLETGKIFPLNETTKEFM